MPQSVPKSVPAAAPASSEGAELTVGTLTATLEALQSPQPPALPAPLAQLVHDYWQTRPLQQALVEVDTEVARSAPELGRLLADLRREASFDLIWAEHRGTLTAALLVAVWVAAVRAPRLKAAAPLTEWLEVLLPVSRYLEPALHGEGQRSGPEALDRLKDVQWVKGWVGDPALAQQIARHTATETQETGRHWFQDRRRRGVEHLLTGIRIVLGQGPLPPGSITKLLPGVEPAPGIDSLHSPGAVTLQSSSTPGPSAAPLLPLDYVARTELPALVGQLTSAPAATAGAIVLSGITGGGKTTLAAGMVREPTISAAFPDGILWASANQGNMLEDLCRQAGLAGRENEPWAVRWRRWSSEPARRALVILDDVADAALLAPIAGGLGPQMALVITTQFGDAVTAELAHWQPPATIRRLDLEGLGQEDARRLFEHSLGRELEANEVGRVSEVGELLGWHAGGLAFAAAQAREYGWDGLLAGLREGGLPSERLRRMVQCQWERLAVEQQADLSALVHYARGRGPFGSPYAMAAWNLKNVELTETRLTQLARAGLIERLQARPGNLYLSPTLWRVAPVVERALRETDAAELTTEVRRALDRTRLAGRLQGHAGSPLRVPWQFQLLQTPWFLLWGALKLLIGAPAWLIGQVSRSPQLLHRWLMWTLPGAAEEHLLARWQRLGLEPTQEVRLLYDAGTLRGISSTAAAAAGIVMLVLFGLLSLHPTSPLSGWGLVVDLVLMLGVVYWLLRPAIWRAWLAHLYGVRTWDLRMAVWACRVLGMRDRPMISEAPEPGIE